MPKTKLRKNDQLLVIICLVSLIVLFLTIKHKMYPAAWVAFPQILSQQVRKLFWSIEIFGFTYFAFAVTIYLFLMAVSYGSIKSYLKKYNNFKLPKQTSSISLLIPAYNEEKNILGSITSALGQDYLNFEVIVINDSSSDETLEAIKAEFNLKQVSRNYEVLIKTREIKAIYQSSINKRLFVVDKAKHSGKSDSLNIGINVANHPFICTIDADTILRQDALKEIIKPVLMHPEEVVAVGGTIRIMNDCKIVNGKLIESKLPRRLITQFQFLEYLRDFICRPGWADLNSLMILSGSFSLFRKSILVKLGGFSQDTVSEDMELAFRLHRYLRRQKNPYLILSSPTAIGWTEAPEDVKSLSVQRRRWFLGLIDAFRLHKRMVFNYRYGIIGFLTLPFLAVDLFLPAIILLNYILLIGSLSPWSYAMFNPFIACFIGIVITSNILLSWCMISIDRLTLEATSLRNYPRLYLIGIIENFGYRQLLHFIQVKTYYHYLWQTRKRWGRIERRGF